MEQSTTPLASPARQDPPRWVRAAFGAGAVALALGGISSCAGATNGGQGGEQTPAVVVAPPVSAEVRTFQATLSGHGMPAAYSPEMVRAARYACEALDAGMPSEEVAFVTYSAFNEAAGRQAVTLEQAGVFVGASAAGFCPRHRPARSVTPVTAAAPGPPPGPATSFANGTHVVGEDIAPGTYKASPAGTCYWARLSSTADEGDIIANHLADGPTTVTIKKGDAAFVSRRCGTWQKVR